MSCTEPRSPTSGRQTWCQWKGARRADVITSDNTDVLFCFFLLFLDITCLSFQADTPRSLLRLLYEVIWLLFNSQLVMQYCHDNVVSTFLCWKLNQSQKMNYTYVAQYSVWCQQRLMGGLFLALSPVVHSMFNWPSCPRGPPLPFTEALRPDTISPQAALTTVHWEINQMSPTASCWCTKWTDTLVIIYCRCALNQGV